MKQQLKALFQLFLVQVIKRKNSQILTAAVGQI